MAGGAASGTVGGVKLRLVKPLTFMNLSGKVLAPWLRRPFWAAGSDLIVVADEVQLETGTFRFRARGSAGGHNGLKSIEQHLKSKNASIASFTLYIVGDGIEKKVTDFAAEVAAQQAAARGG